LNRRQVAEVFAQRALEKMGLTVMKVAESRREGERTCDFRAVDGVTIFWVEVKTRTGDAGIRPELQVKDVVLRSRPMGYSSRMASVISRAVTQLDALARREEGFEILWMMMRQPAESTLHFTQAVATVFGSEDILDWEGDGVRRPCYFFKESSFFKHKSLDAMAVFGAEGSATLCLNPCSPRVTAFRGSAVFRFFDEMGKKHGAQSVLDPEAAEKAGEAYIVDRDIPRRDPEAVMTYIREKYRLMKHAAHFTLDEHSAITLLPPAAKPRPDRKLR